MTQAEKPVQETGATTRKASNVTKSTVVKSNVAGPLSTAYDGFSPEIVSQIKEQAQQARSRLEMLNANGIKLGEALAAIKSLAETDGRFKYILKEESINMSETWAYGMIAVYEYHQTLDTTAKLQFSLLAMSSQKLLASRSTPEIVREAVIETVAETGKAPTKEQTTAAIQAVKVIKQETGQPVSTQAAKEKIKQTLQEKKPHGNSTAVKSTKPTTTTKPVATKELQQPKAPHPKDNDYSPSANTVVFEQLHEAMVALKKYIGSGDKADALRLKDDAEAIWLLASK